MLSYESVGKLSFPVVTGIAVVHLLALLAVVPWFFSWTGFGLFLFFYWLTGGLGITLCFHRLLTHHSFKTPNWFKYVLTVFGTLAFQGSVLTWVGTHRIHHKHSDQPGDPHSPRQRGFNWAHMFWFMYKHPAGHDPKDAAKDLQRDKWIMRIDRFFWLPQVLLTLVLFGLGFWYGGFYIAMSWIIWGIGVRTAACYHAAWLVNSACHTWGYKNYKTDDDSRNNWWVAILSFGEGWHNNHHGDQHSAAHGQRWFEFDQTYWTIRALQLVKLVREIKLPDSIPKKKVA